jgi:UDP-2,3-diacylglucosamine hydrolase
LSQSGSAKDGGRGSVAFVGDVHLDRDDSDLAAFIDFLDRLGSSSGRIVFMGDLFNIWLGRRELELPHQAAVVERLKRLREHGVSVRYVEGNRDYRIDRCYRGEAVDEASYEGFAEERGGTRVFAAHGDLANVRDLQYRTWRRFSRSALVWGLFNLLPAATRVRLAERMEHKLRGTNLEYKREFPEQQVREYGAQLLASGFDAVVLGHFHVEKELLSEPPHPPGRILVLPEWKESRRHLELREDGSLSFVQSDD